MLSGITEGNGIPTIVRRSGRSESNGDLLLGILAKGKIPRTQTGSGQRIGGNQRIARTTPPSTRSAAPLVADEGSPAT
jgi:hypothetical protein